MEEYGNYTNSLASKMERLATLVDCLPEPKGKRQTDHLNTLNDLLVRVREALRGDPRGTDHAVRVWVMLTWIESTMEKKGFPPAVIKSLKSAGFEEGE